ncbi:hypothetical protein TRV_00976, partial [Trichophyton verrucosum HKI 0517]
VSQSASPSKEKMMVDSHASLHVFEQAGDAQVGAIGCWPGDDETGASGGPCPVVFSHQREAREREAHTRWDRTVELITYGDDGVHSRAHRRSLLFPAQEMAMR